MRPLLMAMTCYGSYIDTFFDYCLPSLMAPGNLPILRENRDVAMVIHTDNAGAQRFKASGIEAAIFCDVKLNITDKYQMIGIHQHQDLATAKEHGADYHLLMPDFIYSENCFAGVLKAVENGHKAICRLVMSSIKEDIAPYIVKPRSAIDLATLGLEHIHPGIANWLMGKSGYPATHVLAWKSSYKLTMCSPHCTPVYIANKVINIDNSNSPLDCVLDKIIDGDIYFPKPEDEIVIIEISPLISRQPTYKTIDLKEFCRIFRWDTKESSGQLEIFQQETVDAIHPLDGWNWNDLEIFEEKSKVMKEIKGE